MTRADNSNPEMERIVKAVLDWITTRGEENPYQSADWLAGLEADAGHSALLSRLLDGGPVLEHKPPLHNSYPWYDLIENGSAVINARFCDYHKVNDGGIIEGEYWSIGQNVWWVTGHEGVDKFFLKHSYGWRAELTPARAHISRVQNAEWVDDTEPGYLLTITGWEKPSG